MLRTTELTEAVVALKTFELKNTKTSGLILFIAINSQIQQYKIQTHANKYIHIYVVQNNLRTY